jgi:hypothetical protein
MSFFPKVIVQEADESGDLQQMAQLIKQKRDELEKEKKRLR